MAGQLVSRKRIPLEGEYKQKFIDIDGNEFKCLIKINQEIGRGGSCICYDVDVFMNATNRKRMILKQFYPYLAENNEISVSLNGTELIIDHWDKREDIQEIGDRFEKAFVIQNELASRTDVVVKPVLNYFSGATKLVLYEINQGESLDKYIASESGNLLKMLEIICETAKALSELHHEGYVHMDLKPDNILWNHKHIKFFDFDGSVNMEENTYINTIYHDDCREQLLAPEVRNVDNKRVVLRPGVDIFALGSILFEYIMGRYPTDEECRNPKIFRDEFIETINHVYDIEFTLKQQEALFKILANSVQYFRDERYESAEKMANDLHKLGIDIQSEQKKRYKKADNNLLSAFVLDAYPVYDYQYMHNGKNHIDVAIIGQAPMRDAFLKNIFACAQMFNTVLNIRVLAPDAHVYLEQLIKACPQLKDTTQIYLNQEKDKYIQVPLNKSITKEPFANLYFYEAEVSIENVLEKIAYEEIGENMLRTRYYLMADLNFKHNRLIAEELIRCFENVYSDEIYIGYGKRGNGGCAVITDLKSECQNLNIHAFCADANITDREKIFKTDIYKKALGIHTFYTKEYDEKQSKEQIKKALYLKDKHGEFYNLMSSIRCALSIKYKYAACGIPVNIDNAKVFYELVLDPVSSKAKNLFERLIWLEHQSWMCFMIMLGYQRPTLAQMENYIYKDGNDHRDKTNKLHPCISASDYSAKKILKDLTYSQWNNEKVKTDKGYDELDRMSLELHALCEARVKKINLKNDFDILTNCIQSIKGKHKLREMVEELRDVHERMLHNESNINIVWDMTSNAVKDEFKRLGAEDALNVLKSIQGKMKIVKERNLYHDYKSSDSTIIQAIPWLVMDEKKAYQRIYKVPSENMGDMIISTLLIEPNELILVVDEEDRTVNTEAMVKTFLNKRGLGHINVCTCTLDKVNTKANSKMSGLDITGCDAKWMMKLARSGYLTKMPVFRCQNGKIVPEVNDDKGRIVKAENVRYYNQPRHITVEETLGLYDAGIIKDDKNQLMMMLDKVYMGLWKSYVDISDAASWRAFVQFIRKQEQNNYWILKKSSNKNSYRTAYTDMVSNDLIKRSNMDVVLEQLKKQGYLSDYALPPMELDEGVIELNGDDGVVHLINQMVERVNRDVYHKFYLMQKQLRDPLTEEKLSVETDYIHDVTLVVKEKLTSGEGKLAVALETVLNSLQKNGQIGHQQYVVQTMAGKGFVTKIPGSGFEVCFKLTNEAVKQCLFKEGNVLETFVFHTLLQKGHLDDIKANVSFVWDISTMDYGRNAISNEIDLICTKGLQTIFISCKQAKPEKEFLTEIKYFADYLGINAKAILICSHNSVGKANFYENDSLILNRSKIMDVYFVNRALIGSNPSDIESGKLAKIVDNIVADKKDWWIIE